MRGKLKTSDGTSLDKGLLLLQRILSDRGETPFRELAKQEGLPSSTAHRLLAVLIDQGFVSRIDRGRYEIGWSLLDLIRDRQSASLLVGVARPVLEQLSKKIGLTVHLGVWENQMVTYLVKSNAQKSDQIVEFTREGMQLEAYCSGVGKVLLTGLPKQEREAYLEGGPFIPLTKHTTHQIDGLRRLLRKVAQQKYARDDREFADNLCCLAVPVQNKSGQQIAAISASMSWSPNVWDREDELVEKLQAAAISIAKKL